MHLTMTVNQVLVAGLILALLVMAGALVVLAIHGLKLMKNVDELVDESKVIASDAGVVVKDAAVKIADNAEQVNKVAMGLAGAIVAKKVLKVVFRRHRKKRRFGRKKGKK